MKPSSPAVRVVSASQLRESHKRLRALLAEVHAQMPAVPEGAVNRDIEKAMREVRREPVRK
jgi:hypothetical protein